MKKARVGSSRRVLQFSFQLLLIECVFLSSRDGVESASDTHLEKVSDMLRERQMVVDRGFWGF
jgi:hypothetical protein